MFLQVPIPVLSRVLPFAIFIAFIAFGSSLVFVFNSIGLTPHALYASRVIAVSSLLIYFWSGYSELILRQFKSISLPTYLCAFLSGIFVFVLWIFPYPDWFNMHQKPNIAMNPTDGLSPDIAVAWLIFRMLGTALVVPIMEELFWRSLIMRWIDDRDFISVKPEQVSRYAFIVTACLFALEHNLWLAGLFAGLVYGYLYIKFKNLWVPIFAHAVTNATLGIWVLTTHQWQYW